MAEPIKQVKPEKLIQGQGQGNIERNRGFKKGTSEHFIWKVIL